MDNRYGKALAALCNDFTHADPELRELLLLITALWFRIERQLLVLRNVSDSLGDDLQILQNQLLGILQSKLEHLNTKIEKLSSTPSLLRCVSSASWADPPYLLCFPTDL